MMIPDVQRITDDWPDWIEHGIDCIRCVETRGDLVLYIATDGDYMSELMPECIPAADEEEIILEIFNGNREERLYRLWRDHMWNHCRSAVEKFLEDKLGDIEHNADMNWRGV